ncbi:lycopene cyclase domain-containing protein [Halopenitus sp. H-Gu1]|uniref:lycopene cyclase domain-containing protein n=1 Tax=Halopenitus sp. H-Gu1 TaxID=3242697 RepID=UPI00359EBB55
MTPPITYFEFHALLLAPPIVALIVLAWCRSRLDRRLLGGMAILSAAAIAYTTPWDAQLITAGVWWYGEGVVTGRIRGVPLGEYAFFLLQPMMALAWTAQFPLRIANPPPMSPRDRLVGALAGVSIGIVGWTLLGGSTLYLGAILLWAGPVLAVQWAYDWRGLHQLRRTMAIGVIAPTVYLCLIDRIAIGAGLWRISTDHTTGIAVFGLPIEEATFFLVTNVFLVQGLLAYVRLFDSRTRTEAPIGGERR